MGQLTWFLQQVIDLQRTGGGEKVDWASLRQTVLLYVLCILMGTDHVSDTCEAHEAMGFQALI